MQLAIHVNKVRGTESFREWYGTHRPVPSVRFGHPIPHQLRHLRERRVRRSPEVTVEAERAGAGTERLSTLHAFAVAEYNGQTESYRRGRDNSARALSSLPDAIHPTRDEDAAANAIVSNSVNGAQLPSGPFRARQTRDRRAA